MIFCCKMLLKRYICAAMKIVGCFSWRPVSAFVAVSVVVMRTMVLMLAWVTSKLTMGSRMLMRTGRRP